MKTSESITKIAPALLKAQKAMGGQVGKGAANPFFKSKYADLNAVLEATVPHFNDNGITVLQPTIVSDNKNYVETILLHESGEFVSSLTEIKVSKQNDAQAEGSGISYARRYGLQSFANLAAVDDDGEKATDRTPKNNTVPPKQAEPARAGTLIPGGVAAVNKPSAVAEFQAAKPKTTSFKAAAEAKKQPVIADNSDDLDL